MTTITVLGGTGFAGRHLVREAHGRGHRVVAVSRHVPEQADRVDGVEYRSADVQDAAALAAAIEDADVVIAAMSPRGGMTAALPEVYAQLADAVAARGARVFVVGGFSSLRRTPDAPRMIDEGMGDAPGIPAEQLAALIAEASAMNSVLVGLEAREDDLAWTFFSPGMDFGAHVPGERTGRYRVGTDGLVLVDDEGRTAIGGADFALAVLDEVDAESPRTGHLAVAY